MKKTDIILWIVFIALLAVLLPHTAWAFSMFEPAGRWGTITAWSAAFAFEAAIAVLVHKLARHIEGVPNYKSEWRKFAGRYLNAYSFGLALALVVSVIANLSHAVEFGQTIEIIRRYPAMASVYAVAFGAILPFVSLLFARVLSNVSEIEAAPNPELDKANAAIRELRAQLRKIEGERDAAEAQRQRAEQKFGALGELLVKLFAEEKKDRILAAAQIWPQLPKSSVAVIAGASASYVTEILQDVPELAPVER